MSRHSSRGAAWERLRLYVLDRDDWTCQYCGNDLYEDDPRDDHKATADHIVAKVNGGRDEPSNVIAACLKCNGTKQDREHVRVDWLSPSWFGGQAAA